MTPLSRIIMVSPHPWNVPHPVNDHIAELANGFAALRDGGDAGVPEIVVVAPSLDPVARRATRRALRSLARGEDPSSVLGDQDLQVGSSSPRRYAPAMRAPLLALGLPIGNARVGLRSSLRTVLDHVCAALVYVHDPLHSDLTRSVVRTWSGLTVAAMHEMPSINVLQHLTAPLRERLLDNVDLWVVPAHEHDGYAAAIAQFVGVATGSVQAVPALAATSAPDGIVSGSTTDQLIVVGRGADDDAQVRDLVKTMTSWLSSRPGVHITLLSRWQHHHRPRTPATLRGQLDTVAAPSREMAVGVLSRACAYIALPGTAPRAVAEAHAAGVPVCAYPVSLADLDELVSDVAQARRVAGDVPEWIAADECVLAQAHLGAIRSLTDKQQVHIPAPRRSDTACLIDLHMHTNHSWDCATDPEALLYVARKVGLTAVAVTDHNEISGALACAELAEDYDIQVIVGEEVKTAEGEVIGLFLTERIAPGLSWEETIRRIREQDGLVYVPHPFDRLHTIPSARTLRDSIDEIDAFETYNARLAFEQFNRDAERFARKYNLIEGAGSDAHVVQGLGTAAVRMPAWDDPESFLNALRQGEILRRPKNLLYLQGLKWINDVSGRSKQSPQDALNIPSQ